MTGEAGTIVYVDLTTHNAELIRDFYVNVVGWKPFGLTMDGYDDYVMLRNEEFPVAGICHAKGPNANLPARWLVYIMVPDLTTSLEAVTRLGGTIIDAPRFSGDQGQQFCIIKDPAGAHCGLYSPPNPDGEVAMAPDVSPPGAIDWRDICVPDAVALRDFYSEVVGWTYEAVQVEDYEDFTMIDSTGAPVAGICHARGINAELPSDWLVYITVKNLDESLTKLIHAGGAILAGPNVIDTVHYCVVRDPAGAPFSLYQP